MAVSKISNAPYTKRVWKNVPITWNSLDNPSFEGGISVEESGYTAKRIIGWESSGTNKTLMFINTAYIVSNDRDLYVSVRMDNKDRPVSLTANSIWFYIEYEKNQ